MGQTDQVLARYAAEIEERQQFIDGIVESAGDGDMSDEALELVTETRKRIEKVNGLMAPLIESQEITQRARTTLGEIALRTGSIERPPEVEYRSAGAYIMDYWQSRSGSDAASERLKTYHRAASHQTTADNPGLLPTPIVQPVINFIDTNRPMTTWLGPRDVPSNTWNRPRVTQHTTVAEQPTGEKNELVSQKMTIVKDVVTARSWGGYVNVSNQDIAWSQPQVMDLIVEDLAARYGVVTEAALGTAIIAAAPTSDTIPTGATTAAALNAALWKAAGSIFTATAGQGRLAMFLPPDQLAVWGSLLLPVNPTNAISQGFEAANFGSGAMGQISGIPVYMTAGLPAGSSVVVSSAAVEVYEDRRGSLSVIEPSVLGVQVAYYGYYTWLVTAANGLAEIIKTP